MIIFWSGLLKLHAPWPIRTTFLTYLCIAFCVSMEAWPEVSSHVTCKTQPFIEEDTRYKKHSTQDNDPSVPFKVGTLGPQAVLPITISCPIIIFSWISSMVWNLFPSKGNLSLGESQKSRCAKSGLEQGRVTWLIWCFTKLLCSRRDTSVGTLLWWSCQSAVAYNCSLLNHPNSFQRAMFKFNAKFEVDLLHYLLSHFECNGHTVHMLTQWHLLPPLTSTIKLSLFTHMHSSPLSWAVRLHWYHVNHVNRNISLY